jgi:hypothetical protein
VRRPAFVFNADELRAYSRIGAGGWVLKTPNPNDPRVREAFRRFLLEVLTTGVTPSQGGVPAARLLDLLGSLLDRERQALLDRLEEALGYIEHAHRRIDALERKLDDLRSAAAEREPIVRRTLFRSTAAALTVLPPSSVGYAGGILQSEADVRVARIQQETELTRTVMEAHQGTDGPPSLEKAIAEVRKAAVDLELECEA